MLSETGPFELSDDWPNEIEVRFECVGWTLPDWSIVMKNQPVKFGACAFTKS